jgi:hypothetical protein
VILSYRQDSVRWVCTEYDIPREHFLGTYINNLRNLSINHLPLVAFIIHTYQITMDEMLYVYSRDAYQMFPSALDFGGNASDASEDDDADSDVDASEDDADSDVDASENDSDANSDASDATTNTTISEADTVVV